MLPNLTYDAKRTGIHTQKSKKQMDGAKIEYKKRSINSNKAKNNIYIAI